MASGPVWVVLCRFGTRTKSVKLRPISSNFGGIHGIPVKPGEIPPREFRKNRQYDLGNVLLSRQNNQHLKKIKQVMRSFEKK